MKDPLSRTKVVIRHLPPSLSQSDLFHQIDDRFGGRYNWFCFRPGKSSLKHQRYSRAYIDFKRPEDVVEFAESFDGHVFVNEKGAQYKTIVEYSPSQRAPKLSSKKDGREGTIYKDPDYLEFLKLIAKPTEHLPSAEIQLERKEAEQAGAAKEALIVTPLMEYVRQKRAVGSGSQGLLVAGKGSRRGLASAPSKPGTSSAKRVSEKKKYILKDNAKSTSRKDKSNFIVVPRRDEQQATSSRKETSENEIVSAIEGSVSGLPVIADSGKRKILLLKGKEREISNVPEAILQNHGGISGGNSPVSSAPKQNQRRESGGRLIRSILLHNEARQSHTSTSLQSQQKSQGLNSEHVKRLPRLSNTRSGANGHISHSELSTLNSEGDRKRASDDKYMKKDSHGMSNVSEKQEKRTRNKDRPDRGVWTPFRRADVSNAGDERTSSAVSQPSQLPSDTPEGSHRHLSRRGTVHTIKEDGNLNVGEGKPSRKGASAHGANEKQVWVQKSSSVS
ncbi:regulator of nonsense transcripts UPF3 isoform X2 [Ziziphus jujuba]|uniref:Regulator of nonsense transcripts UPF3 isoform X2 n=1 Tax=Ziziphus jujuba TaxID=326968 RepID=A0A6P6GAM2_ZIZJJ|nr:regulator of nonsense transcripts UPF3 isoform X2 [Ziziphus jujuba]XP_048332114.2 regulator of nonsense transcripts UPF3 isoform X2 [Ziziphus jujuba]